VIRPEAAARPAGPQAAGTSEPAAGAGQAGARASHRPVHTDMAIAGVILAGCVLVWAATATFEEVPAALAQGIGPAVFPRLILAVTALLALWLAWAARGRPDAAHEPVHRSVYLTGLAVLAFMGVLQLLGMYAAILFAVIGIGRLWGERRWWLLAAVAIGMAAVIHLAFVTAFGLPLPQGLARAWLT
jgi:hypothetical protein